MKFKIPGKRSYDPTREKPDPGHRIAAVQGFFVAAVAFAVTLLVPMFRLKLAACILAFSLLVISMIQWREYYKEKYIWDHYVPLWNPEKVYDRFALQLEDWCETGTEPESCSANTAYGLDRQDKRLVRKGISMTNRLTPGHINDTETERRESVRFTGTMTSRTVERDLEFSTGEESLCHIKEEQRYYAAVSDGPEAEVADFYFARIEPDVMEEFVRTVRKCTIPAMLLMTVVSFVYLLFSGRKYYIVLAGTLAGGVVIGGIAGYLISLGVSAGKKFYRGKGRKLPAKAAGTGKKLTRKMEPYESGFNWKYFEGRVLTLIRMAVYSDDPSGLSCWNAGERGKEFEKILDMTYAGGMVLRDFRVMGESCLVTLRVYFDDVVFEKGTVSPRGDVIEVTLQKKESAPTKERLREEEWVIRDMIFA